MTVQKLFNKTKHSSNTASLYMHIPFCASFCDYCDFYSEKITGEDARADYFLRALLADVEMQLAFFNIKKIPTAYIGGGTPSVIGADRMGKFLGRLQALFAREKIPPPHEFSVEANPESLTEDFLRACLDGGITRVSVGVQSFNEASRTAVKRSSDVFFVKKKLELAARHFSGNFSVDIMSGLPFQNEAVLMADIESALAYGPSGVSLYSLILEPQSPLAKNIGRDIKKENFPQGEAAENLWLFGVDALKKAGYEHYEVSNFALNGKRCEHNIRYWRMENWIGAGPAASGTFVYEGGDKKNVMARRCAYKADLDAYLAEGSFQAALAEDLMAKDLMKDTLLMGYRFCEGPDKALFQKRFSRSIEECIPKTIARWKDQGSFGYVQMMALLDVFLREAFIELDEGESGELHP